jgi:hypothetical protein
MAPYLLIDGPSLALATCYPIQSLGQTAYRSRSGFQSQMIKVCDAIGYPSRAR